MANGDPFESDWSIASLLEISDDSMAWRPLTAWLAFFFRLGELVATEHERGSKTCSIVVPPVRSFAGAFCATGAVVAVARAAQALPAVDEHFAYLTTLAPRTAVVVKMGQKIYAGSFLGIEERDGHLFIRVEYGGMTNHLPKQDCQRVQIGGGGKKSLPRSNRPSRGSGRAIEDLLGPEIAEQFMSVPTVDAVIVGELVVLEQELTGVKFRRTGKRVDVGSELASLLRPARLLTDGGIPRSLLISDRVAEFEMPVKDTPHVVVFDGARAFSRYRNRFTESSWIAVLDRCSASFAEGVNVANGEFAIRKGVAVFEDKLDVPLGTEAQSFTRR
jgi:hypothetical protein